MNYDFTNPNPSPLGLWPLGNIWSSTNQTLGAINYFWVMILESDTIRSRTLRVTTDTNADTYAVCVRGSTEHIVLSDVNKQYLDFDEVVVDIQTGLVWQRNDSSNAMAWNDTFVYCDTLNVGEYDDWRVPTVNEVATLISFDSAETHYYNLIFDFQASILRVHSSTTQPSLNYGTYGTTYALMFNGQIWEVSKNNSNALVTRCVR